MLYIVVVYPHGVLDDGVNIFYKNAFKNHLPGTTVVIATFHSVVRRRKVNDIYFSVPHNVLSLSLITKENKALTANNCHLNKINNSCVFGR